MSIEVTARHMKARGSVQEYARSRAEEICSNFPRVEHVHVILDIEKRNHVAHAVVQAKNHIRVEAAETSENLRMAIDGAVDKVEKQLRKLRDKIQDHKGATNSAEAEEELPAGE